MKVTFSFGKNWKNFVQNIVDPVSIEKSKDSLLSFLPRDEFKGRDFIDIGCGSGLFSLSALLLGCKKAVSLDCDPYSIAAAKLLGRNFKDILPVGTEWDIMQGSILDERLVADLAGKGDIVYAWGSLHHTGRMWDAIDRASKMVKTEKYFIISIYNRTPASSFWNKVKKFYNQYKLIQPLLILAYGAGMVLAHIIKNKTVNLRKERGMHVFYDVIDWLGGYPYEYACFDEVRRFVEERGFKLLKSPLRFDFHKNDHYLFDKISPANTGCNEFIFKKL